MDLLAVVMYTYCPENHLGHLFWSDGVMQYDYECFGDVLAFDSIYRKNLYNRPWPKVVVTDGDESMKEAIRTEFPNATHQLCTLHLVRNDVSNIKDYEFCAAFKNAVYGHFEVEEFDQYWADMVAEFGVYQVLGLLVELVENLEQVVKDYRNNEFIVDYKSLYSEPVITTRLESIERAMESYGTTEKFMFRKFRKPHWVYSVLYESNSERYECFCKLWNSIEIPCSHIICVLKELEKDALSMRLVLKRWCKDVNSGSFHDSDRAQRPATYEFVAAKIAQLLKEIEAEFPKDNS
ncbi:hypothetical protein Ahy_A06g029873 [Arachis hypogaea]|uniref:SWIM-type domain-containing protein n=1 Tax=Arachis hypogaea TaxID=3818 RepID=A0A445CUG5_ARAHY|nr:hypothetical protein Ahy_A06g029873 [Arachis hypogaea]